ncbi:hypothetical protein PJP10_14760 [Mycobacterium kansasii]
MVIAVVYAPAAGASSRCWVGLDARGGGQSRQPQPTGILREARLVPPHIHRPEGLLPAL